MSAYVVDQQHIRFLVNAAKWTCNAGGGGFDFRWVWNLRRNLEGGGSYEHDTIRTFSNNKKLSEVGQMLWDENIASVLYRYPGCTREKMPGLIGETFVYAHKRKTSYEHPPTPAQTFKAIDGLDYQSCEFAAWRDSQAFAFLESLRQAYCRRVEGYDAAAWEVDHVPL